MPWDCFCPRCSACVVGGMTDDPEEMEKEMEEYFGYMMYCESCGCVFDFDTNEIMPLEGEFQHAEKFKSR